MPFPNFVFIIMSLAFISMWIVPNLSSVVGNDKNISNSISDDKAENKFVMGNFSTTIGRNSSNNQNKIDQSRNLIEDGEPRKKKEKDLMTKIMPMTMIPFMLQTAIIPVMLSMLKMMLLKSAFLGKMAILLGILNFFTRSNNQGGVYTHNINLEEPHGHHHPHHELMEQHYGYSGGSEYGAYINGKKRGLR